MEQTSVIANESLARAIQSQSVMNYQNIFDGFIAKGIDIADIKPRENVFTFNAWKALGRTVRKGEHGVKAVTFVPVSSKETPEGKKDGFKIPKTTTVFHISQTQELTDFPVTEAVEHVAQRVSPAPVGSASIATKLRKQADALQAKIDHAGRPMTQNPTPKRNREYQSRMIDSRNMERTQRALLVLADAHDAGTVPGDLASVTAKDDIARMVRKGTDSRGYYSIFETNAYADSSPAARKLQEMIDAPSPERLERERLQNISTLEAEVKLSRIPGYFPTPAPAVSLMLQRAAMFAGAKVLEPSAGNGNIADAVAKAWPTATIEVVEQAYSLRAILTAKRYTLVGEDFMQLSASEIGHYDRILMNPPFERQQDIDHVRKAFSMLIDGGRLVAIMAPGFEFRSDRKSVEFREWLQDVDAEWEELPDGSFKSLGTGVSTRMVTIERRK